jgi:hypothetical protein
MERAFEQAEASLRLEGMTPTEVYFGVKERVLVGEITLDQGAEEINAYHTQMGLAREFMRENRDVLRKLAGTKPELESSKRFRVDEYRAELDAAEKSGKMESDRTDCSGHGVAGS